jgi:class 3 adenylate cyclase
MAVFGVPSVREDDALRAVRAASELGEREALNAELEHGVRIVTRTGFNTGEVIGGGAGHQKLATGDAVDVAARLEQAAAGRCMAADGRRRAGVSTPGTRSADR